MKLLSCDIINYKPEVLKMSLKHDETIKSRLIIVLRCFCDTICYIGFGSGLAFLAISGLLLTIGAKYDAREIITFNTLSAIIMLISSVCFLSSRHLNKKDNLEKELNNADVYYHNAVYNKNLHKIGIVNTGRKYCSVSVSTHGDGCMIVEHIKFKTQKSNSVDKPTIDVANRVVLLPHKRGYYE